MRQLQEILLSRRVQSSRLAVHICSEVLKMTLRTPRKMPHIRQQLHKEYSNDTTAKR